MLKFFLYCRADFYQPCYLFLYRETRALGFLTIQRNQHLLRILYLSNTRVSVLPEVKEFLAMFRC